MVIDAVFSPSFHHSGIFAVSTPSPLKVREIGCAGANQAIEPSVGRVCSFNLMSSGRVTIVAYWNVVVMAIVICVVESPSRTNSIPLTISQLTTASPNSPLEISIVSFSWSIMSP